MFDPAFAGRYGIADFDWSNGKLTPDGRGWQQAKPMNTSAVLIEQAARVKAANPLTHVWVYRQLVKALPWYRDIGEKLANPKYSGWFIPFRSQQKMDESDRHARLQYWKQHHNDGARWSSPNESRRCVKQSITMTV